MRPGQPTREGDVMAVERTDAHDVPLIEPGLAHERVLLDEDPREAAIAEARAEAARARAALDPGATQALSPLELLDKTAAHEPLADPDATDAFDPLADLEFSEGAWAPVEVAAALGSDVEPIDPGATAAFEPLFDEEPLLPVPQVVGPASKSFQQASTAFLPRLNLLAPPPPDPAKIRVPQASPPPVPIPSVAVELPGHGPKTGSPLAPASASPPALGPERTPSAEPRRGSGPLRPGLGEVPDLLGEASPERPDRALPPPPTPLPEARSPSRPVVKRPPSHPIVQPVLPALVAPPRPKVPGAGRRDEAPVEVSIVLRLDDEPGELEESPTRARLVAVAGPLSGKAWFLNRRAVTLGRGTENDIVLLDIGVSRRHLRLERHDEGFAAIDSGSGNGTFLNGRRITRAELFDGDKLELGSTLLAFETVGTPRVRTSVAEGTDPGLLKAPQPLVRSGISLGWLVVWCLATFVAVLGALYVMKVVERRQAEAAAEAQAQEDARSYLERANAARAKRAWEVARRDLEVARALAPDAFAYDQALAELAAEVEHGRWLDTARQRAQEATPGELKTLLARIPRESAYSEDAQKLLGDVTARVIETRLTAAREAFGRGQLEATRALAEEILRLDSGRREARALLDAVKAEEHAPFDEPWAGRHEPAEDLAATEELLLAQIAYQRGDLAQTASLLERVAARPVSRALFRRARLRAQWVNAERLALEEAQRADPTSQVRALERAVEVDRSLGAMRFLALAEQLALALAQQGQTALASERLEEAAALLRRARELKPDSPMVQALGLALSRRAAQLLSQAKTAAEPERQRLAGLILSVVSPDSPEAAAAKGLLTP